MRLRYQKDGKHAVAELLHCNSASFLFIDGKIRKLTNVISDSDMKEVSECVEHQKLSKSLEINPRVFELVRKELGEFEIIL